MCVGLVEVVWCVGVWWVSGWWDCGSGWLGGVRVCWVFGSLWGWCGGGGGGGLFGVGIFFGLVVFGVFCCF